MGGEGKTRTDVAVDELRVCRATHGSTNINKTLLIGAGEQGGSADPSE